VPAALGPHNCGWSFFGDLSGLTTRQLAAHLVLDDDTLQSLAAAEVDWSVVSGPITEVGAAGNATAAAVYQTTPAVVRASHTGMPEARASSNQARNCATGSGSKAASKSGSRS